jgi:hypothetical protein
MIALVTLHFLLFIGFIFRADPYMVKLNGIQHTAVSKEV